MRTLEGRENKWLYIVLCIIFTFFLFPYLTTEAFSIGVLLGLSFIWSSFVAISFGFILRHPASLIIVFLGVVLGSEAINTALSAKETFINGEIIGAIVLLGLSVYLIVLAGRMKTVEMFED